MVVTLKDGEYRVNFKGGSEATAYYTNDSMDALQTGVAMTIEGNRHKYGKNPRRKRAWKSTRKNPSRRKRVRPRERSAPRPDLFHPPYNVQIDLERDNLNIWLSDRDDKNIAHWHDDDARSMIEDGFFSDKGGKKLAESVVEYARSMGMIK
jgi:hypothetical protein